MNNATRPTHVPARIMQTGAYWVVVPDIAAQVAVLNGTGRAVFELCDGSRSLDGIVEAIAAVASTDPALVRDDVQAFMAQIDDAGLLEPG